MLFLIDSSAVLNDFSFEFRPGHAYITTPIIIGEFRDMRSRLLMENALSQRILSLQEPEKETLGQVESLVRSKGFDRLSKADLSLLALALDLKKQGRDFILITDDYSIQNFAKMLKIPFEAAMRGKIGKEISFSLKCPACGKALQADSNAKKCPDCGSKLQRKRK
ncbi:MAG: hypothetical protein WC634_01295 [archaeon]